MYNNRNIASRLYGLERYIPVLSMQELTYILNGILVVDAEMRLTLERRLIVWQNESSVLLNKIKESYAKQR